MRPAGYLSFTCAMAMMVAATAPTPASEIVMHSFGGLVRGANPQSGLIRDLAGNLYGTTLNGGLANAGVVYKVDPTGRETLLHSFTGGADGGHPYAGVIVDPAGNLYGTTYDGGSAGAGVVFKLDPTGHQTVLYSFTGGADGGYPYAGVIVDPAGNLYGTTSAGGRGYGVVYRVDPTGHETVLYGFTGGADGRTPYAGVIGDAAGNLYGTTQFGGTTGMGVVYKVDSPSHATVLYSFTGGADGGTPHAGVIRDSAGNLYGTTSGGGKGAGVVYRLDPTGHETVLYRFTGGTDGGGPAGVIFDAAGNLYGTTSGGGKGAGVVYQVDSTGRETVLYSFTGGADGGYPYGGVIRDSAGNLYGTTNSGGAAGLYAGVVFKVDSPGHATVLYAFPAGADGCYPTAALTRDPAGNLYGTAYYGGVAGVVYRLDPTGRETVLYRFTGGADGGNPDAGVIFDSAGNLYGTTQHGGTAGWGVLYKLDPTGQETVLYNYSGAEGTPNPGVIRDSDGNFYGTTANGGVWGYGLVYKLDATGNLTWLYSFRGREDGASPQTGVIRDSAGNLYGTTRWGGPAPYYSWGVIYKIDPTGLETVLYRFTGGADGRYPYGGVIRDSAGNLYGTTQGGGPAPYFAGVVYKLDPSGHETVLHSFTGGTDGANPEVGLIADSAGNLYGTTQIGGTANAGVVYKLDPTGQESVLYSFTGGPDGAYPEAGVIRDSAGNLYGTTHNGGKRGAGAVFVIRP